MQFYDSYYFRSSYSETFSVVNEIKIHMFTLNKNAN